MAALALVATGAASLASTPSLAAPTRSDLEAAEERLRELEKDFEIVVERYNLVRDRLTRLQTQIAADEVVVEQLIKRMRRNQAAASEVAVELYKGGSTEALEALLSSDDLADIDARLTYLRSTETAQARVFERLAVDRRLLTERIARLERERVRALAAKQRLADLRTDIEGKIADQRDEIARLTTLIERAERRREARERRAAAAAAAVTGSAPVPAAPIAPLPSSGSLGATAVEAALEQVGDPYQWGASGPEAFDCSGLTMYAWAQAGVALPHSSAGQYAATPRVDQSDLQPGDLLFHGSPIHHVGMYIGGGQMVEAPYTGAVVRVTSAYRDDFVGAGRPGV